MKVEGYNVYLKDMNCFVFVEQKTNKMSTISEEIFHELRMIDAIHVKEDEFLFTITGFIEIKHYLFAILPKGFKPSLSESNISEEMRLLFAVLMKYRQETELEAEEMSLLGGGTGNLEDSLYAAFNLFEDYRIHGLLKREQKTISNCMSGIPHWPATINKITPVFSSGSPVYCDIIRRRNIQDTNSLLVQIHRFALGWSMRKYAWLIGQNTELASEFPKQLPCEEQQAIHLLNNELRKTFISREVNVIKWIINIITGITSDDDETKVNILVTKTFHTVWESICSRIFCNQYLHLKSLLPQPKWTINIPTPKGKISQRPDIIIIHGDKMLILDAKYYDVEHNLPGWHDSVKQFFYALSIKKNIERNISSLPSNELKRKTKKVTTIENAFIMPTYDNTEFAYIGNVTVNGISDFGKIKAFVLNTKFAMRCYIGEERFPLNNIIDKIVS